jgi:type VI secretion system protein ImpL
MAKDSSVWRGNWGRLSITTLIAVAIGLVIWKNGDAFGLTSNGLKLLGSVGYNPSFACPPWQNH